MNPVEVRNIAHLARLRINEQDIPSYARDLSAILALAEQMQTVDTAKVEALAHPLDMMQRLRDDVVTETDQRELFQAKAPLVENGLYLVPKVIE